MEINIKIDTRNIRKKDIEILKILGNILSEGDNIEDKRDIFNDTSNTQDMTGMFGMFTQEENKEENKEENRDNGDKTESLDQDIEIVPY